MIKKRQTLLYHVHTYVIKKVPIWPRLSIICSYPLALDPGKATDMKDLA